MNAIDGTGYEEWREKLFATFIGTFVHLHPTYEHQLDSISTASRDKRFRFISWI